jgi:hypothetical protein
MEGGRQKAEDRRRKTEDRKQKTETWNPKPETCLSTIALVKEENPKPLTLKK